MRWIIRHATRFAYDRAVTLSPTTVRLRPREDATQRILAHELRVEPHPMARAWIIDAEGNACERLWFGAPTPELSLVSVVEGETVRANPYEYVVNPAASAVPIVYAESEAAALVRYRGAPRGPVEAFAQDVAKRAGPLGADVLRELGQTIAAEVQQIVRPDGEALPAAQTLEARAGACRDTAVLFIEAARAMGFAARFVSGYQEPQDGKAVELHAWAEVYLPDAGWRGYDPAAGVAVADRHLALAAGATAAAAAPTEGTYGGEPAGSTMDVSLSVQVAP